MSRTASFAGRVCLIGLALAVVPLVAGCTSDRCYQPQSDTTNVVQRPTYDVDRTKTLYFGGYAGANYDDGVRPGR
jgi:hypothetical protein